MLRPRTGRQSLFPIIAILVIAILVIAILVIAILVIATAVMATLRTVASTSSSWDRAQTLSPSTTRTPASRETGLEKSSCFRAQKGCLVTIEYLPRA